MNRLEHLRGVDLLYHLSPDHRESPHAAALEAQGLPHSAGYSRMRRAYDALRFAAGPGERFLSYDSEGERSLMRAPTLTTVAFDPGLLDVRTRKPGLVGRLFAASFGEMEVPRKEDGVWHLRITPPSWSSALALHEVIESEACAGRIPRHIRLAGRPNCIRVVDVEGRLLGVIEYGAFDPTRPLLACGDDFLALISDEALAQARASREDPPC